MSAIPYGLKFPTDWNTQENWASLCVDAERLPDRLKEWGVGFVEIPIGEDTPAEDLLATARTFAQAGLRISVHPYVKNRLAPEAFDPDRNGPDLLKLLQAVDALADVTGRTVPMVFHGGLANLDPHDMPRDTALANAKTYVHWMGEQVDAEGLRLMPLCETQVPFGRKDRMHVRLGDTWETCMELVEGTEVGICWDLGHSYISAAYGYHAAYPPEAFLDRVRHVHAHDVKRLGETRDFLDHCALGKGEAPWGEYFHLLADRGFDGWVLFELDLAEFGSLDDIEAMFKDSARRTTRAFDNGRPQNNAADNHESVS